MLSFGVGQNKEDITKNTVNEFETIQRDITNIDDRDLNEANTKLQNIQNYITNLMTSNRTSEDIQSNVENVLEQVNDIKQNNLMVFENCGFKKIKNSTWSQQNQQAAEIVDNLDNAAQQIYEAIQEGMSDDKLVQEVDTMIKNGTYDETMIKLLEKAEQTTSQSSSSDTTQKSSMEMFSWMRGLTFTKDASGRIQRREHNTFFGNKEHNEVTNEFTKHHNEDENLTNKTMLTSVLRNTDLCNQINQAYNKTVESIVEAKRSVSSVNDTKVTNAIKQNNEMKFKDTVFTDAEGLMFTQANDAKNKMTAVVAIESILNDKKNQKVTAIASDMLGITGGFDVQQDRKATEDTTKEVTQGTEQKTENKTDQSASNVQRSSLQWVVIVIALVVGIVLVVALVKVLKPENVKVIGETVTSVTPAGAAGKTAKAILK